jgi:major membrane immunogen (membrane-anchored lipoprotein)
MKKLLSVILTLVFVLSLATACGKKEEAAAPTPAPAPAVSEPAPAESTGPNGTFKAEADKADDYGWKAFVELTYENGKLTKVDADELKDGKRKTEDAGYNDAMKAKTKMTVTEAYDKLEKTYLETGKADVVAGATQTSNTFKGLVEKAEAEAKK